jgi:hypothetical protein
VAARDRDPRRHRHRHRLHRTIPLARHGPRAQVRGFTSCRSR